jgi:DNA-binding ferritin-like protein
MNHRIYALSSMRQTRSKHHNTKKLKSCSKSSPTSPTKKTIIVENFIEMLNTIKLYHWNTHSFSQHKATDELHERLSGHIDKFVETLMGKKEDRIKYINSKIPIVDTKTTRTFRDQIYQYREYLINMDKCLDKTRDTDLLNIRDEILGDINQFLYLMTLH